MPKRFHEKLEVGPLPKISVNSPLLRGPTMWFGTNFVALHYNFSRARLRLQIACVNRLRFLCGFSVILPLVFREIQKIYMHYKFAFPGVQLAGESECRTCITEPAFLHMHINWHLENRPSFFPKKNLFVNFAKQSEEIFFREETKTEKFPGETLH